MKRLKAVVDIAVSVLIAVAAGIVIWRQFAPMGQDQLRPPVEDANGTVPAEVATHVRGTGPVALVEFADFECPACANHVRDVEPMIIERFVQTGVVRHIFLNNPLGSHLRAVPASEAALCAGKQGKFWEMHDALFRNPTALSDADLTNRAHELGLDAERFSECVKGAEERSLIERHRNAARALGAQRTPSFFLGLMRPDGSVMLKKRINGALPFSTFHEAIMDVIPPELKERVGSVALNVASPNGRHSR